MEGFDAFEVDALEMGLVPNLVIPPKFKVNEFEKYKGSLVQEIIFVCIAGKCMPMPTIKR